jgi:hypothetical protein
LTISKGSYILVIIERLLQSENNLHYLNKEGQQMKSCGRILLLTLISLFLCISVSFAKQTGSEYKEGELIVKFKSGVGIKAAADTHAHVKSEVVKHLGKTGVQLVKLKAGLTTMEAVELYKTDPNVLYAEPNYILHALDVFPNDPNFNHLWGLHNIAQTGGNTDADIDAPEAWQITTGSSDVIVAVIDTGVDYNHEDLAVNIWKNLAELNGIPGVDDDGNGYVDDIYGIDTFNNDSDPMDDHNHGTHVSGTIGAVGNNGIGVAGINWNVRIMALKFISSNGYGYTSDAIECLEYAIMMKQNYGQNIKITSNSWGGKGYSKALRDAIQEAGDADILFIAAAGNDGSDNDTERFYPSSYDPANIISVAATDHNDKLASFSNWGLAAVDVAAPGVNILSSTLNNGYEYFSGTSMATPHVAGLAAMILAKHPEYSYTQVKENIFTSADPIAGLDGRVFTGSRINAVNALTNTLTCDPSRLRFIVLSPSIQFGALKDSQNIIRAFVATCRGPINNATVTVDFSNGDPGLTLHDDGIYPDLVAGDGLYSGLWVPEALGEITLNINASVQGYSTVSNNISGAVADLTANFSAEPTSGQSSLTVHFTDLSRGNPGIQSWHWTFGDGETSTEQNPSHTYYRSGNFTVSLTITYETLKITKTISGYIKVSESPPPEINSITPVDGWMATQMPVTIIGSNFQKNPNAALYGGGPYTIGSINLCGSEFYISGNYAYVACPGTLQIIDIADPANPKNIIYFSLPGDNFGIYVSGNYSYVVKGRTGLQVIDVSNPANPVIAGSVDTPGYAMALQISGNYAYVADEGAGLQVIDVSNPANPVIAGSVDTPGYAMALQISGNYAYVADDEAGLQAIDITNPAKPFIAGSCYIPDYAYNIYVSGNYAYVTVGNNGYLRMVDISNPSRPRIVGNLDMPGNATNILISGNVAYVTIMYEDGRGLLEILDITDLTKPIIAGYHSMPQSALRVHTRENHAYVASRFGDAALLEILDITHLTNPTIIASRNMPGTANGIYVSDKYAYISIGNENNNGLLNIMDISDPFNPVKTGSCNTPGYANSVYISGNYAYVADGYAGLRVIDITNPANPIIMGYVDTPGNAMAVHVSGNFAYVADGNAGLQVIDVTNPSNPIIAGSRAPLGYGFYGVYISGNYAYVTDWNAGLLIIDIANPANPTVVGSCKAVSATGGVYVSGNYAYIADYYVHPGLTIVDITDPLNPFIVGAWGDDWYEIDDHYYSCYDVHVQGNYAYVACIDSIYVIDISVPYNPVLVGSSQTPGKAQGLYVRGDSVYVADGDLGLMILKTLVPFSNEVWFGSDKIMAAAPAGLLPGVYNLHVSNMDGRKAIVHNAFTVKKGVASISVSPVIFNFDNVTVGASSLSQTFLVSNTGETDLVIDSSSITGQDIYDFNMQNDNCLNKTLAPSSTCTVQVIFSPATEGLKNANLSIPYTLPPPSDPTGLTATVESSSRIDLLWTDNSNNEIGFKIERKEGAEGIYSQIAIVGPDIAAYSDMGLMPGTIYCYRIRTYNEAGDSNYSNEANATTLPLPPTPPTGLTTTAVSPIQINLSWTDNSNNEVGFKIERKEGAEGIYSQIATVGLDIAAYSDMGLMPGTIYCYRIRTYNEAGDSNYSNEANATTLPLPPSPPTGLTTTAVSPIQINLSWTDNSNNEVGFKIERKEGSGGAYFQIATVGPNITVYSDRGLTPNTTYYYNVRAYNENGDSSSSEASATTFPPSQNITLNITYPLTGDTILRPDVLVIGDIINTIGNETGVTVNGIIATVYGNQFIANHVPLEEGLNTITAIATDTAGDTVSTSITVNAITTGDYIRMTSNIESGIIPLEITMKIDGSFSIPDSTISVTGPAQPEFLESVADGYEVRMTVEGIYYFTASVTGPDSNVYQDTIAIIALNQTELDNLLKNKWERMKNKLQIGDIEGSLVFFDEYTKHDYSELFNALASVLPNIVQEMSDIQLIKYTRNAAIYDIRTIRNGIEYSFQLLLIKDSNGIWRITSF